MNLDMFITSFVTDQKGNIINKKTIKANSFVQAFLITLAAQFLDTTSCDTQIKDTAGTSMNSVSNVTNFGGVKAGAGSDTAGIQVGTSTAANTISTFALTSKISHGAGAGQLSYSSTSVNQPTITSTQASFVIQRTFQNNSGGTIVVNEVGLIGDLRANGIPDAVLHNVLFDRTLNTQTVLNGQTLTEQYAIIVTV